MTTDRYERTTLALMNYERSLTAHVCQATTPCEADALHRTLDLLREAIIAARKLCTYDWCDAHQPGWFD